MNLPKNRSVRLGLFAAVSVLGLELIAVGIGAFRLAGVSNEFDRSSSELMRLRTRALFPSVENISVAEERFDALEYKVGEYGAELKRDSFPAVATDAAAFSALAQDVIERFQKRASQAGIALPESSEVGFAAYASQGKVPTAGQVPRLSRQLYSVERVAGLLVDCGVQSIVNLSRDMFEESGDTSRTVRRRSALNKRGAGELPASRVEASGAYYIERITVSFTADEPAVWRVLESFATAPHCMAVVEFSHRTQSDILTFVPDPRAGEVELSYLTGGFLAGESALTREERLVAGNEMIRVDLVVDVYNFNPEGGL
jgi:hypothetical protein